MPDVKEGFVHGLVTSLMAAERAWSAPFRLTCFSSPGSSLLRAYASALTAPLSRWWCGQWTYLTNSPSAISHRTLSTWSCRFPCPLPPQNKNPQVAQFWLGLCIFATWCQHSLVPPLSSTPFHESALFLFLSPLALCCPNKSNEYPHCTCGALSLWKNWAMELRSRCHLRSQPPPGARRCCWPCCCPDGDGPA
jgi:hypothetical protein